MSKSAESLLDDADAAYCLVEVRQRELREAVANGEAYREETFDKIAASFEKYRRAVYRERRVSALIHGKKA